MLYSKKNSPVLFLAKVLLLFFIFTNSSEIFAQATISVEVVDGGVQEEGSNPGSFRIFETSGQSPAQTFTVEYTISGTASGGDDYTSLSGVATFLAGTDGVFVDVDGIIDDNTVEGDETVTITVVDASGVEINLNADTATITITDNDIGIISVDTLTAAFVDEAVEGGANGNFRFRLDKGKGAGVPLNVSFTLTGTADNSGGPIDDYDLFNVAVNAAQDVLLFQEDLFIQFRQIDLEAFNDPFIEGDETVTLTITGTDNPLFEIDPNNNTATVTIIDATAAAGINVNTTTGTTTEAGGTTDFIFTLTTQPTDDVRIPINLYDATETSGPNAVMFWITTS